MKEKYEVDNNLTQEKTEYEKEKLTKKLKLVRNEFKTVGKYGHGVKHIRNSQRLGYGENAKRHFMEVNNCNELEFAKHLAKAQIDFEERNKIYRWKMIADLEKFGGRNIEVKEIYIPLIKSEYKQDELNLLKNECSYAPGILDINIDNYQGTISVTCDKTNKIEWFDDKLNLLDAKYNFGEKFNTNFSVKDLKCSYLKFKLTGEYGEKVSKKFYLIKM